jgi:hypothetical protein
MAKISDLLASLQSIDIVHIIQKKQFLLVSINPCKFGGSSGFKEHETEFGLVVLSGPMKRNLHTL